MSMTLPDITYILRITHSDSPEVEEYEYMTEEEACSHLWNIACYGDSSMYDKLDIVKYNWITRSEKTTIRYLFDSMRSNTSQYVGLGCCSCECVCC